MKIWICIILIILLVVIYLLGYPTWSLGLLAGILTGSSSFYWITKSVKHLLGRQEKSKVVKGLIYHSGLRCLLIGLICWIAIKYPSLFSIWALLIGYTLTQVVAASLRASSLKRKVATI